MIRQSRQSRPSRLADLSRTAALLGLALSTGAAYAGTITGNVVNKTTNKPSIGDAVTVVNLQSPTMDEVAHAKTDSKGHFSLTTPADGPYLVKVEHQGTGYFKNMPPGSTEADITVYDSAEHVEGVSTEADVLRMEVANGQLKVTENYFVRNLSNPPRTQNSGKNYEIVLPADAVLDGAAAQRPNGLPLSAPPDPTGQKGHYVYSFPIAPNDGDNGTRFQILYHLPYNGKFQFKPVLMEGADNVAVMLPKAMSFTPGPGSSFQPVQDDGSAQTFLARNVKPGQSVDFTVSGTGSLPRDSQGPQGGDATGQAQPDAGAAATGPSGKPGGGIGNPIANDDPLSKYKWWILSGLALLLAAAAALLLRKPVGAPTGEPIHGATAALLPAISPAGKNARLLEALKEELFTLESEKIEGTIDAEAYAELKSALEIVLKRALRRANAKN